MAASLGRFGFDPRCVLYLILSVEVIASSGVSSELPCARNCSCSGAWVDCSGRELTETPPDLPARTQSL